MVHASYKSGYNCNFNIFTRNAAMNENTIVREAAAFLNHETTQ